MSEVDISLKTRPEIERLRLAAVDLHGVFAELNGVLRPEIASIDLDRVAQLSFKRHGLKPELPGFGGYPHHLCVSVNNVAAHGLPDAYVIRPGDLVTVDASASRDGWMADAAWTFGMGGLGNDARRVLRAGWRATIAGCRACVAGNRMGDIGSAISKEAARHGCTVVREFTGHGIGRELHEPPAVPHEARTGEGEPLVPGMVLNIEPVVTNGSGGVTLLDDGWGYVTSDGSLSAQFELTVAVIASDTLILNLGGTSVHEAPREPPHE